MKLTTNSVKFLRLKCFRPIVYRGVAKVGRMGRFLPIKSRLGRLVAMSGRRYEEDLTESIKLSYARDCCIVRQPPSVICMGRAGIVGLSVCFLVVYRDLMFPLIGGYCTYINAAFILRIHSPGNTARILGSLCQLLRLCARVC